MASSRLERIGNIYTRYAINTFCKVLIFYRLLKIWFKFCRMRGLLRSGAIKPEDKPLWYDVYEAFPPKIEPQYGRKAPDITIRNIFYPEDIIRA